MRTLLLFAAASALAADFPQAEIAGGGVKAKIYLPDPATGYYRATRFDWAGVIPTLEYKGRQFFGQWFPRYDPKLHDSIVGPVESFDAIGYDQAKPGGTFLRIGVGLLRRPDNKPINNFTTFEIVQGGQWTVQRAKDNVELTHDLPRVYLYRKTIRLANDKPMLILEHSLKNTGKDMIETDVYNHDFFMLGGLPSGPQVTLTFPFTLRGGTGLKNFASIRGGQIIYQRELAEGESFLADLHGFEGVAQNYDIRVENRQAKVGVHQTGDSSLIKLHLWSIRSTVCPEAYTHIRVEPGKEMRWRVAYEFYTLN